MNIIHILHEFPFPPNSGIRCDMTRRLAAFRGLGHKVFVVCWASVGAGEMPLPERMADLADACNEFVLLPIGDDLTSFLRRMVYLRRYPSYVGARIPRTYEFADLMARIAEFSPDVIWLEGIHPAWLALELKSRLHLPLVYRSHNIEHRYLAEQSRLARSPRLRMALRLGTWGLEKIERRLHVEADQVYDISIEDLAYWESEGLERNSWLAPQSDPSIAAICASGTKNSDIDLLFVGSLSSPNNIAGLNWFRDEVLPIIRAEIEDVNIVVAGRNPDVDFVAALRLSGINVLANPESVAVLFAHALVTFNPILHGSGVNIKTIDMLSSGRPVITTRMGARGLPTGAISELSIADSPYSFAKLAICNIHAQRKVHTGAKRGELLESIFGVDAVRTALAFVAERFAI